MIPGPPLSGATDSRSQRGGGKAESGESPTGDFRPAKPGRYRPYVFHNDVIAVSNRHVLFCHQQAFARQSQLLANLRSRVNGFMAIEVPAAQVSVSDAVSTYLFNSQLLSRDDGSMMLVLPQECQEHAGVWGYLNELLAADNPISELKVLIYVKVWQTAAARRACGCAWY